MFPQIPYGFQTNVRLYRANSTIGISNISVVSFVGEVRNALSSMGLRDVNSYTDLQLVRYADSLVGLNGIATQTYLNSVKQAQSIIEINPVIIRTLLSRLSQATSIVDLTNVSTTATGSLIPSGQLYWRSITQDEWRGITQDQWRSIEQSEPQIWTPANITTQLWLDAADASTITLVADAVSQWNDKSGNARHVSQSNSGQRPTVATASLNGLNGLNFDGGDFLRTSSYIAINNPSSNSMLFVVSESSGTARYGVIGTRDVANNTGWLVSYFNSTSNPLVAFIATGVTNSAIGSSRAPDIIGFVKTANTLRSIAFINAPEASVAVTLAPVTVTLATYIGTEDDITSNAIIGKIYEVIEITTNSLDIRQRTEGYLAHKWGLTANLPADHPYKNSPPIV